MKKKTKERMIACTLTGVFVAFLWLLAGLIEIHRHQSNLNRLVFSERFEPIIQRAATVAREEATPAPKASAFRPSPHLSEIFQAQNESFIPLGRGSSTALSIDPQKRMELSTGDQPNRISSGDLATRSFPNSSQTTLLRTPKEKITLERRPAPQRIAALRDRPDPSTSILKLQTLPRHEPTRVLKEESSQKIVQWMRIMPSDLPPGIQRHMEYQPGNLTSSATLKYKEETWEIYLMARLPSEELHVVIVKGNQTYYVVDPSFKREGRRFRIGVARRTDGVITGVASEERAASSEDALLHYDVFLTWWDQLNVTLQ